MGIALIYVGNQVLICSVIFVLFVFFIKFIFYSIDFTSIKISRIHKKEFPNYFYRHKVDVKVLLMSVDLEIPVVPIRIFIISLRIATRAKPTKKLLSTMHLNADQEKLGRRESQNNISTLCK